MSHGKRKLTPTQREEIVHRYIAGESTITLGMVYGVSSVNVCKLLRVRGVARRSTSEAGRRLAANHTFFDEITTERQAYWLGFFLADGHAGRRHICVRLALKDEAHVKQLQIDLGSEHKLIYVDNKSFGGVRPAVQLYISSPELASAINLIKVNMPKMGADHAVPPALKRHFWRGQIDGDGFIGVAPPAYKGYAPRWRVLLTTSNVYCAGFLDYVKTIISTKATVRRTKLSTK